MSTATGMGASRRELLIFLYKYRLRLVLSFLLPLAVAVFVSTLPTPRYKSSSVLVVRMGSEYVYQPEISASSAAPAYAIPLAGDQIFKSEVAILSSDDLHQKVIDAIGIETLFPEFSRPTGAGLVIANIKARVDEQMQKYGLSQKMEVTPEEAQLQLRARAIDRFDKRLDIALEKDSAVINLSFEHKDRKVAARVLDTLLKLYFEKRRQLFLQPRTDMAEGEVAQRRDKALAAGRALENFKREHGIFSLEDQRSELLKRRSEAQQQSVIVYSPAVDERIRQYTRQLDQLDGAERRLIELEREADIADESYTHYAGKLDEAKAYDNLQRERADSVRIIQTPTVPPEPKKIQGLILLGGVLVSLICALAVAALTEFSRSGFLTPEQLERSIGLPVLGVIPMLKRR